MSGHRGSGGRGFLGFVDAPAALLAHHVTGGQVCVQRLPLAAAAKLAQREVVPSHAAEEHVTQRRAAHFVRLPEHEVSTSRREKTRR